MNRLLRALRCVRSLWCRAAAGESGSAVVEFVFLGVLLLVPLMYLVLALARLQAGAYATAAAAREAGRAYVTSAAQDAAPLRAESAARIAFADQGFHHGEGHVEMTCDAQPCLRPEGSVTVRAEVDVPLPLVPRFADGVVPLHLPVSTTHLVTVDRFRGAR